MIKNKKLISLFFITALCIIGFLPVLNLINKKVKDFSIESLFNTDILESGVNYSFYKLINTSLDSERVIVGKNNYFFLGNRFEDVIHKSIDLFKFNDLELDNWVRDLQFIQEWYIGKGVHFMMVLAPNKHTIYGEKLPNWIPKNKYSFTDNVMDKIKESNILFEDTRSEILDIKNKSNDIFYYKTDSHWSARGASIAYERTIDELNKIYNNNIQKVEYSIKDIKSKGRDLSKMLKINSLFDKGIDSYSVIKLKKEDEICIGNINKGSHALEPCKNGKNTPFYQSGKPVYTINKTPLNDLNLLLLADSFSKQNSQLYNSTFKKIWKFHYNELKGERLKQFVDKHNPDYVIYQVVERNLMNANITKGFSYKDNDVNFTTHTEDLIFDLYNPNNNYVVNDQAHLLGQILKVNANDPQLYLSKLYPSTNSVLIDVEMFSHEISIFKIYYKNTIESKYNETDSLKYKLKVGMNKFKFEIPSHYLNHQLRIDFTKAIGDSEIKKFKIYNYVE